MKSEESSCLLARVHPGCCSPEAGFLVSRKRGPPKNPALVSRGDEDGALSSEVKLLSPFGRASVS